MFLLDSKLLTINKLILFCTLPFFHFILKARDGLPFQMIKIIYESYNQQYNVLNEHGALKPSYLQKKMDTQNIDRFYLI